MLQSGEEIAADVLDGPQSVVIDQAENRLHTCKSIMALTMADHEIEYEEEPAAAARA